MLAQTSQSMVQPTETDSNVWNNQLQAKGSKRNHMYQGFEPVPVADLIATIQQLPPISEKYASNHIKFMQTLHDFTKKLNAKGHYTKEHDNLGFLLCASIDNFNLVRENMNGASLAEIGKKVFDKLSDKTVQSIFDTTLISWYENEIDRIHSSMGFVDPEREMKGNLVMFNEFIKAHPEHFDELKDSLSVIANPLLQLNPESPLDSIMFWVSYCGEYGFRSDNQNFNRIFAPSELYSALMTAKKHHATELTETLGEAKLKSLKSKLESII